ncbi:hypothetical protein MMC09_003070 [Bachmanniomyces sp. S44760]|nr:hypothetical protein [Bachmanniomyces sp. S44760]
MKLIFIILTLLLLRSHVIAAKPVSQDGSEPPDTTPPPDDLNPPDGSHPPVTEDEKHVAVLYRRYAQQGIRAWTSHRDAVLKPPLKDKKGDNMLLAAERRRFKKDYSVQILKDNEAQTRLRPILKKQFNIDSGLEYDEAEVINRVERRPKGKKPIATNRNLYNTKVGVIVELENDEEKDEQFVPNLKDDSALLPSDRWHLTIEEVNQRKHRNDPQHNIKNIRYFFQPKLTNQISLAAIFHAYKLNKYQDDLFSVPNPETKPRMRTWDPSSKSKPIRDGFFAFTQLPTSRESVDSLTDYPATWDGKVIRAITTYMYYDQQNGHKLTAGIAFLYQKGQPPKRKADTQDGDGEGPPPAKKVSTG